MGGLIFRDGREGYFFFYDEWEVYLSIRKDKSIWSKTEAAEGDF